MADDLAFVELLASRPALDEQHRQAAAAQAVRERYALLWLVTGFVLVVLSAWRGGLNTIAGWLGVRGYPPAVLFAVGLLFVILVLLHYSTVISRLSDQNVILAQRLALLESQLNERDK